MGLSSLLVALVATVWLQADAGTASAPDAGPAGEPAPVATEPPGEDKAPAAPAPRQQAAKVPAPRAYRFAAAGNPGPMVVVHGKGFVFTLLPARLELEYALTPVFSVYALPEIQLASGATPRLTVTPRIGARYFARATGFAGLFVGADVGAMPFPAGPEAVTDSLVAGFDLAVETGYAVRVTDRFLVVAGASLTLRLIAWNNFSSAPADAPLIFRPSVRITPTLRF